MSPLPPFELPPGTPSSPGSRGLQINGQHSRITIKLPLLPELLAVESHRRHLPDAHDRHLPEWVRILVRSLRLGRKCALFRLQLRRVSEYHHRVRDKDNLHQLGVCPVGQGSLRHRRKPHRTPFHPVQAPQGLPSPRHETPSSSSPALEEQGHVRPGYAMGYAPRAHQA